METVKTWRQYCAQKILKKMRGDRFGALFANPVLEASDSVIPPAVKESYKVVIPKPMDYSTVKANLDKTVYQTPEEFHEDMVLIYDNCMKFNPSVGVNKWIYDAADSNKAKYLKIWDSSQTKLTRLIAKENSGDKNVNGVIEPDTPDYSNYGSFDSEASAVAPSQTEPAPSKSQTSKFSFRLSLSQINEYKARFALQVAEQTSRWEHPVEALPPPPEVVMNGSAGGGLELKPIEDAPAVKEEPTEGGAETHVSGSVFYDDPGRLPEVDAEETLTTVESDMDMPSIASRREDGVLRVNWLTENECNQLFPHCSIIGLHEGKRNYNVSDVGLRCIYNELYLNDHMLRPDNSKRELIEETVVEDYTMKHHKMISFLLAQPSQQQFTTEPPRCYLQEFGDGDSISMTDEEMSHYSTFDHETSYESSSGNTVPGSGEYNENESTPETKFQTLSVHLTTEATISIGHAAERVLLKNGFMRVGSKNCMVRCCPELTFTSEFAGYYKADESAFIYRNTAMRHLRLFLVNCGKVQVDLHRRCLPLAELILDHGTESEVYALFLESKRQHSRNLAFFQLPNSGKASYSRSMDLIWRLQTVANALPTPFLVLHVICRDLY